MQTAANQPVGSRESTLLDQTVSRVAEGARQFARTPIAEKRRWLAEIRHAFAQDGEAWARAACDARGIELGSSAHGEMWLLGPGIAARNARLLGSSLAAIEATGEVPLRFLGHTPRGGVRLQVTPFDWVDQVCFPGVSAETRLEPEIPRSEVTARQAMFYREQQPEGGVALVLGAGNVDSIAPMDAMYKLFVEGRVVVLKTNPVNAYVGPLLERAFAPLVERGFLAVVGGEGDVGAALVAHPQIDSVHLTGSQATHDAIVWGTGEEATQRRARNEPRLDKPVTSELGNTSPVIVVPGDYTDTELDLVAQGIVGMFTNNASMNCNAAKLIVTARGWQRRTELLDRVRARLQQVPSRSAWYPRTSGIYDALIRAASTAGARHVDANRVETFGRAGERALPWALVTELSPGELTDYLVVEPFCPVLTEVALPESEPEEFLAAAVRFSNQVVPGSLNATLYVSPRWRADRALQKALDRGIDELAYGLVAVNTWGGFGYGLCSPPWGGYPGATLRSPQSGIGWVHNTPMLGGIEKSVVWGVLRGIFKPVWYPSHRAAFGLGKSFCMRESTGSFGDLLALALHALRG